LFPGRSAGPSDRHKTQPQIQMGSLFTIGIPVYNGMPYLPETLDSVLRQTYQNFEILVINDGSTDDSWRYLRSVRDPRLRLLSQENQGLTPTLNRLLAEARTPWLVRLDADDIACPDRLARVAEQIALRPGAGMLFSRAQHHHHARAISLARTSEGSPAQLRAQTEAGYLLAICHSTAVLNVRKTMDLGGYRFQLHIEDLDLWWRMALSYDLIFIPEITVAYRLNSASVCIGNLSELSVHTLYAQYLLLSHLWNLPPLGFSEARLTLEDLVDQRRLRYREHMWNAAICLSDQKYARAGKHLFSAAVNAPGRFVERVRYPLQRNTAIQVGESPEIFERLREQLWPAVTTRAAREAVLSS